MKKGKRVAELLGDGFLGEVLWPFVLVFLMVVGLRDKFSRKKRGEKHD
ncbi:hypothetical protein [Lacticaseibacillus hulanensis]|nr:hypothetical protein [Lacticaseibacillus hulanensis]